MLFAARGTVVRALQGAERARSGRARCSRTTSPPARSAGSARCRSTFGYESADGPLAARLGLSREEVRERNYIATGDRPDRRADRHTAVGVRRDACDAALERAGRAAPTQRAGQGGRPAASPCSMQPYGRIDLVPRPRRGWVSLQADGTLLIRSGVTDLGAGQAASAVPDRLGDARRRTVATSASTSATPRSPRRPAGPSPPASSTCPATPSCEAARALRDQAAAGRRRSCSASTRGRLPASDGMVRASGRRTAASRLAELSRAPRTAGVPTAHLHTWRAEHRRVRPAERSGRDASPTTPSARTPPRSRSTLETGEVRCSGTPPATTSAVRSTRCGWRGRSGRRLPRARLRPRRGGRRWRTARHVALLANYLMPTRPTCPTMKAIIVESGERQGPVRGQGDRRTDHRQPGGDHRQRGGGGPGVRVTQLPITPERLLAAIDAAGGDAR